MADHVATETASGANRGLNIGLWVLQVLVALAFVGAGLGKLTGSPQAVMIFETMGTASWMPYVIGALEILGAIALLIPRLTGIAAAALVVLLAGALVSHAIWGGSPAFAVVLLVLTAVIAWGRRASLSGRAGG